MVKANCGGMLIDDSTLKIVDGIITVADGNPTSAIVANCGGVFFDDEYFQKINNVITDKSATEVEGIIVSQKGCGGLLVDSNYFKLDDEGALSFEGKVEPTPSSEADITSFTINDVVGEITDNDIAIEMPFGTDVTELIPTIVISAGASVEPASGVKQDFTEAVGYTVTAEDGTTTKLYTVTVTVAEE